MFFMITAFLFVGKLLDSRERPIDWKHLYLSRIARLMPFYYLVVTIVLVLVAFRSGFMLQEPVYTVAKEIVYWLLFTIPGAVDLNGIPNTRLMTAGAIWSLPFEWYFYASLPALAFVLNIFRRPIITVPWWSLGLTALAAGAVLEFRPSFFLIYASAFLGGILAAFAVRQEQFCQFSQTPVGSLLALILLAATIFFPDALNFPAIFLLSGAFCLISGGACLFGTLGMSAARLLGEMSYSVYLLHGIVLFITIDLVVGKEQVATFTPVQHWGLVAICTIVLIPLCLLTYRLVERPAMNALHRLRTKRS